MRNVLLGLVLIGAAVLPKIDGQLDLGDANHLASGSDAPKRPLIQLASGSDAPKRPLIQLASGSDAPKRPLIQLASGSDAPKRPLAA